MPQSPWLSGWTGVPRMHEEVQLSSRRGLWDLRQVPCLGCLCSCCCKVHESKEIVLCGDRQWTCGQEFFPLLCGWSSVSKLQDKETVHCGKRRQGEPLEEACWPLHCRYNADFTVEIKLSHQRRCLMRNFPLLSAPGSVAWAQTSK